MFQGTLVAPARVASYLLKNSCDNQGVLSLEGKLNVTLMARILGLHRVTVGKAFSALLDEGIVATHGRTLVVVAPEKLQSYADGLIKLAY